MNFNRVFHYKPSIWGYPYFWFNTHTIQLYISCCATKDQKVGLLHDSAPTWITTRPCISWVHAFPFWLFWKLNGAFLKQRLRPEAILEKLGDERGTGPAWKHLRCGVMSELLGGHVSSFFHSQWWANEPLILVGCWAGRKAKKKTRRSESTVGWLIVTNPMDLIHHMLFEFWKGLPRPLSWSTST